MRTRPTEITIVGEIGCSEALLGKGALASSVSSPLVILGKEFCVVHWSFKTGPDWGEERSVFQELIRIRT